MIKLSVAAYERLLAYRVIRWALCIGAMSWARLRRWSGSNLYLEAAGLFRAWRALANVAPFAVPESLESECRKRILALDLEAVRNSFEASFHGTNQSKLFRSGFLSFDIEDRVRLRLPRNDGDPQRQGDLIVMKPPVAGGEKGVLMVMYSPSIATFAAIFDLPRLAQQYRFVLEPSTWGYEDADFLLFLNLPTEVVILAQYEHDYSHISSIGRNLLPVRLGAGDWADPDRFSINPAVEKEYDAIMVASWLRLKRHHVLFDAIRGSEGRIRKVALVGMPSDGRVLGDVQAEAKRAGVADRVAWYESVPHSEVSNLLQKSHVSLMLSSREGASRIIYESMFCDVPVILSECNVGVNRDHINPQTGRIVPDDELSDAICWVRDHSDSFSPRRWALQNTGYQNATKRLQSVLRRAALDAGEPWTIDILPKISSPNLRYASESDWSAASPWFRELEQYLI